MMRDNTKIWLAASIGIAAVHFAFADENVHVEVTDDGLVFTANRIATKAKEVGASTSLVTEEKIEQGQYRTIQEALMNEAGVTLAQSGQSGPSGMLIRGVSNDHTLVMLDGVIINDPMSTGNAFNYTTLGNLMNIDRIEVLKGPQSSLYGSDAMGGVVQIFTKKGKEPKTVFAMEAGSFKTIRSSLQTSGMTDKWQYSALLGAENSQGISSAAKTFGNNEKDGWKERVGSVNVNYMPFDNLNFDLMLRYNQQKKDYDRHAGKEGDDPNNYGRSKHFVGHFAANAYFLEEMLKSTFSYNLSNLHRKTYNDPDLESVDYERERYKGKVETYGLNNTLSFHKDFNTQIGFNFRKETGESQYFSDGAYGPYESRYPSQSANMFSAYLVQNLNFGDKFFNTVSLRSDDHSEFGGRSTYRLSSRYNMNDVISFKGSLGTGFKAPTLYQLYEPRYGNSALDAERSVGYDLGVVLNPTREIELEVTYFNQKFKNMIMWDSPNSTYYNIGRVTTRGVELSGLLKVHEKVHLGMNYTYLDAKNDVDDERLIRRPRHQIGTNINYAPTEKLNLNLNGTYYSHRMDTNFSIYPSEAVKLKPFWLVNVAASYKVNSRVEMTAKINNLFDEDYTTVYGYGEPGISAYLGIKITF